VYPSLFEQDKEENWVPKKGGVFRSVQHKSAAVFQLARQVLKADPEWFPAYNPEQHQVGIYLGELGKRAKEISGWVLMETDFAWIAVSNVAASKELTPGGRSYLPKASAWEWSEDKTVILLNEVFTPILFYVLPKKNVPTLEKASSLLDSSQLELTAIVVPGHFHLEWSPVIDGEKNKIEFPVANDLAPKVNGAFINYSPPMLMKSPYLSSEFQSGIWTLESEAYYEKITTTPISKD
jgi:hypothetical protein